MSQRKVCLCGDPFVLLLCLLSASQAQKQMRDEKEGHVKLRYPRGSTSRKLASLVINMVSTLLLAVCLFSNTKHMRLEKEAHDMCHI